MTDLKLLDGTVEDVLAALKGASAEDRAALLAAEKTGKNRKGVTDALQPEAAVDEAKARREGDAEIIAATSFDPSGAPAQVVPDVDPSHPAVDVDPRANTTAEQNRIDFNDPGKPGVDVVSEQLGMTKPGDVADAAE